VQHNDFLRDGDRWSWPISPGTYTVRMTASDDGATLTWVGATCDQAARETTVFNGTCTVTQAAQLVVANPCSLCEGKSSSVSVLVTRP
jgi:hypothetical protein